MINEQANDCILKLSAPEYGMYAVDRLYGGYVRFDPPSRQLRIKVVSRIPKGNVAQHSTCARMQAELVRINF
jgi:hypothetical protein